MSISQTNGICTMVDVGEVGEFGERGEGTYLLAWSAGVPELGPALSTTQLTRLGGLGLS